MSDWISVKDRMPEGTTAVLVWCPERRNKFTACWEEGHWWYFGGQHGWDLQETVTHWMPTPEPPMTLEERITITSDSCAVYVNLDGEIQTSFSILEEKKHAEIYRTGLIETMRRNGE